MPRSGKFRIIASAQDEGADKGFRSEDLGHLDVDGYEAMIDERDGVFNDLSLLGRKNWGAAVGGENVGKTTLRLVIFGDDGRQHHAATIEYPRTRDTWPQFRAALKEIFETNRGYSGH